MKAFVIHVEKDRNIQPAVARIETDSFEVDETDYVERLLEYCFRWTQNMNIDGSWSRKIGGDANDDVTFLGELIKTEDGRLLGARSTVVGDLVALEEKGSHFHIWKVKGTGFKFVGLRNISEWSEVREVACDKGGNLVVAKGVLA
jgi:hypothetical protein